MSAFATRQDVEAAWRSLTPAELAVIDSRLAFVSAIIRSQVTDVDARITAGTLDAALVKGVTVEVVLRKFRNPEGKSEEQIEDYRYRRDTSTASGSMYLTAEELALLRRRSSGAFSIVPGQEPADCATRERVAVLQARWSGWQPSGDGTDAC